MGGVEGANVPPIFFFLKNNFWGYGVEGEEIKKHSMSVGEGFMYIEDWFQAIFPLLIDSLT